MELIKQKKYNALDVTKFMLATLLVVAHTASEKIAMPAILDRLCSLYVIVVPFFFLVSGFLFFIKYLACENEKERKQRYQRYTKRILLMYLVWSIIYCFFNICFWIKEGTTFDEIAHYLYKCLTYSSYSTIWFLPALWIGVSIVYLLKNRNISTNRILLFGILAYVAGWFCYTFSNNITELASFTDIFKSIFTSYRNGFLYAVVFVALGLKIAEKDFSTLNIRKDFVLTIVFLVVFIIEAYVSNHYCKVDGNYLLGLIPFSYYFVATIIQISLSDKHYDFFLFCRNMSLLMFLSQRIFITALPKLFPQTADVVFSNWGIGLGTVLVSTIIFSLLVIKLSPRFKLLNYLWH